MDTKVFFKETDTHQLLHKTSFHPKHQFAGIIKSQLIRFKRICSSKHDFDFATSILFNAIKKRGYASRFLRRIKSEVINGKRIDVGSHPCDSDRCKRCPYLTTSAMIMINNTTFEIRSPFDCDSDCVIYVITCTNCNLHYVGETKNLLRNRLSLHLSDIKMRKPTIIAQHFNGPDFHGDPHILYESLRITPILRISNPRERLYHESRFIRLFNTSHPFGLNERLDDLNHYDAFVPIVLEYNATSAKFANQIKTLAAKHKVTKHRIITAFKRNKNLKDIISPSSAGQEQ